ncbi:DUF4233 domain-containing protein [Ornithinimicrobium ciconiae]|uniref:DUF4233 domain-containing protein n=1 Tax=Ornithinimicrobium ciconiae TaxID=2594265 RepID=A0A516GCU1_9MICO|nr:DUF4233 domain-containing protein [Ornithinimicrobium ciconiae]QDO89339.1 DUF4233 domain-containing protein [Ornithinimicrobium ciconiae]
MTWLHHVRLSGVPEKATRRLASIVLGGLSLALFFGGLAGRQLELSADGDTQRANLLLIGGSVLAVLAIVAAGSMRRPWGLTLGWVVMGLTALSTLALTAMGIVAVIFGALWVLALVQGPSMEQMTRDWIAEHGPLHPDEQPQDNDPAHGMAENHPTEHTDQQNVRPREQRNHSENAGDTNETTTKMGD